MNLIKSFVLPLFTLFSVAQAQAPVTSQNLPILEARKIVQEELVVPISHNALYSSYNANSSPTEAIKRAFKDPIMLEIAKLESGLNPRAYNPEWHYDAQGNKICQGSYGVFQVACVHYLENPERLYDVEFNIEMADKVLSTQGYGAWGVCRDKIECISN